MKVMVALEERFFRMPSGQVGSHTVYDYGFWQRYLQVFESVTVFARVAQVAEETADAPVASGPGVDFFALPYFVGPWEYLRQHGRLKGSAEAAVRAADAFILRAPGTLASLLWRRLRAVNLPYGIEVVGDPWDSFAPGSIKSLVRPLVRRRFRADLYRQCREATAAAYVTEHRLQQRYPPPGWSTHYSSIELLEEAYIDPNGLADREQRVVDRQPNGRPWRLCHVGMMEHLYKGPDVLIDAVAQCVQGGMDLELVLVGSGRYLGSLREQARRRGLTPRVTFAGKLSPGRAVLEQLDRADLYVLPSRQEGLPRSLIEAMARGLPCVASDVGGIPELLAKEDLVVAGDVAALATQLATVLEDPQRLQRMARRNLAAARRYTAPELNKRRVAFYERVAQTSRSQ